MNCKKCYNTGKIGINSNNKIIYCTCQNSNIARIKNHEPNQEQRKRFDRVRAYLNSIGIYPQEISNLM